MDLGWHKFGSPAVWSPCYNPDKTIILTVNSNYSYILQLKISYYFFSSSIGMGGWVNLGGGGGGEGTMQGVTLIQTKKKNKNR